jgi:DNA (cytosine-5)-methyltransferase 1
MSTLKVGSVCSGIGGFEEGIKAATKSLNIPTELVFAVDIDKNPCKVYQEHYGYDPYGDIKNIPSDEIPEINLLCAGFPCPSFSQIGNREGFDDERGQVFFELCRILEDKQPQYYMFENVKNLVHHEGGKTIQIITQILWQLGYTVEFQVLNLRDFGIPQNRERSIITGHLRTEPRSQVFPLIRSERVYFTPDSGGAREGEWFWGQYHCSTITANYSKGVHCGGETYVLSGPIVTLDDYIVFYYDDNGEYYNGTETGPKDEHHERIVICPYCGNEFGSDYCPHPGISSVFESDDHDLIDLRRLTPEECEQLQGFEPGWTKCLADTNRYKAIGNAVPPIMIEEVAKKLLVNWSKPSSEIASDLFSSVLKGQQTLSSFA